MREQLNSNPLVQAAVVGVLLLAVGIFVLTSGGGGEEESESAPSPGPVVATVNGATATGSTPGEAVEGAVESLEAGEAPATAAPTGELPAIARPVPGPVLAAWLADRTVALLFVHDGGIDDGLVKLASGRLAGMPGVKTFVVPTGSVSYGFQNGDSIAQAVIDAGYKGPTVDYNP